MNFMIPIFFSYTKIERIKAIDPHFLFHVTIGPQRGNANMKQTFFFLYIPKLIRENQNLGRIQNNYSQAAPKNLNI